MYIVVKKKTYNVDGIDYIKQDLECKWQKKKKKKKSIEVMK